MKFERKLTISALALAVTLAIALPAPVMADDVSREGTQADMMMHKLGRGIINVLTGVVEIPKTIAREWQRTDPFTGLVVGSIKGVGWAWCRIWAGIYEVMTFPMPAPEGYVPLIEPEFVMTDIWGDPIPEFNEFPDWN